MCPICGGKDLADMKDVKMGPDPYDYSKKSKDERLKEQVIERPAKVSMNSASTDMACPMCRFPVQRGWKFCPECGVKFSLK